MFNKYSNSFLKDFDIHKVLSKITVKEFISFEQSCFICSENDPIADIYFILSGRVEIRKFSKVKNESLGCIGPGDLIGLEDALTSDHYSKSAYALEKTDTVSVKKNDFVNFIKLDDDFRLWTLKYLSFRISSC